MNRLSVPSIDKLKQTTLSAGLSTICLLIVSSVAPACGEDPWIESTDTARSALVPDKIRVGQNSSRVEVRTLKLLVSVNYSFQRSLKLVPEKVREDVENWVNFLNSIALPELSVKFELIDVLLESADDGFFGFNQTPDQLRKRHAAWIDHKAVDPGSYDLAYLFAAPKEYERGLRRTSPDFRACSSSKTNVGYFGLDTENLQYVETANPFNYDRGDGTMLSVQAIFAAIGATWTHTGRCEMGGDGEPLSPTAIEPNRGRTLMGYPGPCAGDRRNGLTLHSVTRTQILEALQEHKCGTTEQKRKVGFIDIQNLPQPFSVPRSTPFYLDASASDRDGDSLEYAWNQVDIATARYDDSGAVFPWKEPTYETRRSFERGVADARTLKFQFMATDERAHAQDHLLGAESDPTGGSFSLSSIVTVNVVEGDAFANITEDSLWTAGLLGVSENRVEWQVGGSAAICPTVDILLSLDDGKTFPYVLASATPNDGEEMGIDTIPAVRSSLQDDDPVPGLIHMRCSTLPFYSAKPRAITLNGAHCKRDLHCDDGNACNGRETCNVVERGDGITTAECTAGTPLNCDNGLFCDGTERCDAKSGCVAGTPPNTDDGINCTVDVCDDVNDEVVHVLKHSECSDALFCNGEEVCDPARGCIAGQAPNLVTDDPCTTLTCDEESDRLIESRVIDCPETGEGRRGENDDPPRSDDEGRSVDSPTESAEDEREAETPQPQKGTEHIGESNRGENQSNPVRALPDNGQTKNDPEARVDREARANEGADSGSGIATDELEEEPGAASPQNASLLTDSKSSGCSTAPSSLAWILTTVALLRRRRQVRLKQPLPG